MILAAVLATCGLAIAPSSAWSVPGDCPPFCDRIPDSAWIAPTSIPLYSTYWWPGLAGLAVTAPVPRFKFEDICASPPVADDARSYAVAARAVVPKPDGHWQLQVQVMHWRGEPARGADTALVTFEAAVTALRNCQLSAPLNSPSITTRQLDRMAAVISGFGPGGLVTHEYLLADPRSGTMVELAMWATTPPLVEWPSVSDAQVLDAMAAPLCNAYVGSCR